MKGEITLTRIEFGSDLIRFCNLGIGEEDELWCVDYTHDFTPTSITHDTLEHGVEQRTCYVTRLEEEYEAIGAADFIRMGTIDLVSEIESLREYRDAIEPEGSINTEWYTPQDLFTNEEDIDLNIVHWINVGHERAYNEFQGNRYKANDAFVFFHDCVQESLKHFRDEEVHQLIITFDTEMQTYNETVVNYYDE